MIKGYLLEYGWLKPSKRSKDLDSLHSLYTFEFPNPPNSEISAPIP